MIKKIQKIVYEFQNEIVVIGLVLFCIVITPCSLSSVSDYLAKTDPDVIISNIQSKQEAEVIERLNLGYQIVVDGIRLIDVKAYDVPRLLKQRTCEIDENTKQIILTTKYQKKIRGKLYY